MRCPRGLRGLGGIDAHDDGRRARDRDRAMSVPVAARASGRTVGRIRALALAIDGRHRACLTRFANRMRDPGDVQRDEEHERATDGGKKALTRSACSCRRASVARQRHRLVGTANLLPAKIPNDRWVTARATVNVGIRRSCVAPFTRALVRFWTPPGRSREASLPVRSRPRAPTTLTRRRSGRAASTRATRPGVGQISSSDLDDHAIGSGQ